MLFIMRNIFSFSRNCIKLWNSLIQCYIWILKNTIYSICTFAQDIWGQSIYFVELFTITINPDINSSSQIVFLKMEWWMYLHFFGTVPVYWPFKALYNTCHINPFKHTFIHWCQRLPCKVPAAHQEQFEVQNRAQFEPATFRLLDDSTSWATAVIFNFCDLMLVCFLQLTECVCVYSLIQRVWNEGRALHCPRHNHHLGDRGFLFVPSGFWLGSS